MTTQRAAKLLPLIIGLTMKRRVSTRRRRNPRQYDSEDSTPTPHPQKQRKRAKVDPSFIVNTTSKDLVVLSSQEEDEHIRKLDKSGALSHIIGSQSILSQELMDMSSSFSQKGNLSMLDEPVNADCLLCTTEELDDEDVDEETTPNFREEADFREEMETPVSSSQLSFLIGAARALESDNEDDDQNAILQKPPSKTPSAVVTRSPLTTRPLPSTKNPAATKPSLGTTNKTLGTPTTKTVATPTTSKPPPPTKTPTGIVVGKTPTIIIKDSVSRRDKRKAERVEQQNEARSLAQQAASLAAQAIASPEVSKQLLLSMVFVRTNPRSPPSTWPPKGSTIPEGFFWATYPPLETTLKRHMRRYYDLSVKKCQSKEQQAFNNDMVTIVRVEASKFGWAFSAKFSDKGLRDRVRCYFKTHIQNAKKRLRTMLMNPTKRANTKALINHLDMIQSYSNKEKVSKKGTTKNQVARKKERKDARREEGLDQDTRDAVTQVISLGFAKLSQDPKATQVS